MVCTCASFCTINGCSSVRRHLLLRSYTRFKPRFVYYANANARSKTGVLSWIPTLMATASVEVRNLRATGVDTAGAKTMGLVARLTLLLSCGAMVAAASMRSK